VNPDVSWSWIDALGDVTLSIATLKLAKYGLLEEALVTTYRASYKIQSMALFNGIFLLRPGSLLGLPFDTRSVYLFSHFRSWCAENSPITRLPLT
jgi:hypothetical protein